MTLTSTTSKKELLAYEFLKLASFPNGKAVYGLHLALLVQAAVDELPDQQAFINGVWQEILHLPTGATV